MVGKELTSRLSTCAVLLYTFIFFVSFPSGVWGRNGNLIVAVPDHLNVLLHGEDNSAGDSERSKKERKAEEEMGR